MFEQDYTPVDKFVQQRQGGVSLVVQFVDPDGTPIDISAYTQPQIRIQYPDDSTRLFEAELASDGQDGEITYNTVADIDLPQYGTHFIQGLALTPDGKQMFGKVLPFYVRQNIKPSDETALPVPIYIGNPTTEGSWRIDLDTNTGHLVFQRYLSGVWVTQNEFFS